ncbi:hypothetical protein Q4Q34_04550 [Flavivirga abyssicola]|uniref:hypothetical protein n=1 Tax=Flavivirga abyssicola TaxID=3063533 RepID=UPI0026DED0A8|nr:hypothetical protein [Flavivirga sp. MEBiC07777]WVK14298.1 hypothetical protein Q4Q34_04550 [Flavivirga sp. MEBiC07777]
MKTILYVLVFLFIGANFTSCTPQGMTETDVHQTDPPECCGDGGNIPPPPPPPNGN